MSKRTAITALIAMAAAFGAQAQTSTSSYDYASKFYPHPAWMYLLAEQPQEMGQHPAVIVARRAEAERQAALAAAKAVVAQR